jgi:hypothetical protein
MRRMRIGRTGGLLGVTATLLTATAQGQDATAIEEMARRLAEIEKQNETLKTRVNELEAADADIWLTQERSDQIRGVVTDVLADAETRVSLQSSGMTAGWDDGFFLASPDGRFRLEVGGMVQVRYMDSHIREGWPTFNDQGQQEQQFAAEDDVTSRAGFDIPHARLDFKGHVFGPDTRFRVQGEFTNERPNSIQLYTNPIAASSPENGSSNGAFELLDAYILQEIGNGWAIRVGQFKLPFDRGWEVPIANQLTGERNTVALHMGIGRSQGIELAWGGDTTRMRFAFSDGGNDRIFDAYHFSTTQPLNSPYDFSQAELAFSGRVEFKLAGNWREFESMTSPPGSEMGVLLGVGAHWQQSKVMLNPSSYNSTPDGGYNDWFALTGDLTWNLGGGSISAAAYYHHVASKSSYLYFGFSPVGGQNNRTFDAGNVAMFGASLYGSMYLTADFEAFVGVDYMEVVDNGNLGALANSPPGLSADFYGAFADTSNFSSITAGSTWYLDGNDLKWGFSVSYFPRSISPAWTTPETGVRSTPVSDAYTIRTYLQLMF